MPAAAKPEPVVTQSELLDALKLLIDRQTPDMGAIERVIGTLHGRENRSNPNNPRISAFSYPEGDAVRPKPPLAREIWHNSARVREGQCTPEEVFAFNTLSASLPNPGDERSSRDGRWIAAVSKDGRKLLIRIPCKTIEQREEANASSILMFCRELAEGKGAITPQSMASDIAQLQADRARLERILAANGIALTE